jgi:DNA modification methylase
MIEYQVHDGDVWLLGRHRLVCGDATDERNIVAALDGREARLTVTSPPYGVGKEYEKQGVDPWRELVQGVINAIKDHTRIVCWNIGDLYCTGTQFIEPTSMYSTQMMSDAGFGCVYMRIWKKPGATFHSRNPYHLVSMKPVQEYEWIIGYARRDYEKDYQPIQEALRAEAEKAGLNNGVLKTITGAGFMYGHWFTPHQWTLISEENYTKIQNYCEQNGIAAFQLPWSAYKNRFDDANIFQKTLSEDDRRDWGHWAIWPMNTVGKRDGHPAAFPEELPARCIKLHSRPGDLVLDPFGGSGTTMIAAEQLGREAALVERDPKYCELILSRFEKQTEIKPVLLSRARASAACP